MRLLGVFIVMIICCNETKAQKAFYSNSFGTSEKYQVCRSPFGTALDLTKSSSVRTVLQQPYPLSESKNSFSVLLWVKADKDIQQSYAILSSFLLDRDSIKGWKVGVQANGAWYWSMDDGPLHYDYYPTLKRQTIRDGNWHQLAFTYDAVKEETWLYYDGLNVAILYMPGFTKMATGQLLTGGEIKGDIGEWETFNGCIDEVQLFQNILPPSYFKKSYQQIFPEKMVTAKPQMNLSVMNYNIWHGGRETGKETGVARIVDVIKNSGADIISMQETYGSGPAIADALGYYFYLRSSNLSIMSRFPIAETTDSYQPFYNGGAFIRLANNKQVLFFTNWLNYPFDYWDLLEKGKAIDREYWLQQQTTVNAKRLKDILEKIKSYTLMTDSIPIVFCGDFNAGSHLDWVESTKHFNKGYVIPFPNSILMETNGFSDSFRDVNPDPLKERGITWSPTFTNAFRDRIDYIYYKGSQIKPIKSFTISKHPVKYPSDHAAVVTVFKLRGEAGNRKKRDDKK